MIEREQFGAGGEIEHGLPDRRRVRGLAAGFDGDRLQPVEGLQRDGSALQDQRHGKSFRWVRSDGKDRQPTRVGWVFGRARFNARR